jgi:spore coat protein CotH
MVFDPERVRSYALQVDPEDLARIDAMPSNEEYIPASLSFEGEHFARIGMRYKGSAGAFLMPCTASSTPGRSGAKVGKCSIKLAFDEYDDAGRFHGLKKLNLHSMGRDPSLLRERLGYTFYTEMGVASSRVAYVRLVLNGQLQGVYLAVEEIDGRFTRARFGDGGKGNLYKEVWPLYDDPETYRTALEANKGDTTVVDKMLGFARDVREDPMRATRWLDRDYMLRYIAVDRVIIDDDGAFHFYCGVPEGHNHGFFNNHNYFWYEASDAGRFWLIPWDLDGAFANEPRVFIDYEWSNTDAPCNCHIAVGFPQRAPSCDPLVGQWAGWRADYDAVVDQFLSGPFSAAAVSGKIAHWSEQVAPLVDEQATAGAAPDRATWQASVQALEIVLEGARAHGGHDYSESAQP